MAGVECILAYCESALSQRVFNDVENSVGFRGDFIGCRVSTGG